MKNIAFLGDSITYGYGLDEPRARYSTLVAKRLGMEEQNYGITGTLIAKAGLNATDGKDFGSRLELVFSADVAVIFGGTNDYFWSDKPIFGEDESYFAFAADRLCERVKIGRAGKPTLFVTPYPHNGIGNFSGGKSATDASRHDTTAVNFNGHVLADYCAALRASCKKADIDCLDLHDGFYFDHRLHTLDGCHPNAEGHKLLCDAIASKLEDILAR